MEHRSTSSFTFTRPVRWDRRLPRRAARCGRRGRSREIDPMPPPSTTRTGRPLRESGAAMRLASNRPGHGDIVPLTDPEVTVPHADVLAAGFPCQPFSKSGFQRGMEETRGTLFWNIARILEEPATALGRDARERAQPRWPAPPRHDVQDHRPHAPRARLPHGRRAGGLLPAPAPPRLGGRPQVRERVFILAHYVGRRGRAGPCQLRRPDRLAKSLDLEWRKDQWDLERDLPLQPEDEVDQASTSVPRSR